MESSSRNHRSHLPSKSSSSNTSSSTHRHPHSSHSSVLSIVRFLTKGSSSNNNKNRPKGSKEEESGSRTGGGRHPTTGFYDYYDDDPGIMSEVETSSTGQGGHFKRSSRIRASLPIVRTTTTAKPTTQLPLLLHPGNPNNIVRTSFGLVFLQYRTETKRALLPNEVTSLDTVKALFVRSFKNQITMPYLNSRNVRIYIHDGSKDIFYELEDVRDIKDRSVLRIYEQDLENGTWQPVGGLRPEHPRILNQQVNQELMAAARSAAMTSPSTCPVSGNWNNNQQDDPSYFSEPEFESNDLLVVNQHHQQNHQLHRSKRERASFHGTMSHPTTSSNTNAAQSQYYGTIIIPAYRTAAIQQQQASSNNNNSNNNQQGAPRPPERGKPIPYAGYSQTMPRNMSLSAATSLSSSTQQQQTTYGNIPPGSPSNGSQQGHQGSPGQQQRSVSPDLVSKRQHKDQIVIAPSGPGAPPKPQRSFTTLMGVQQAQQRSPSGVVGNGGSIVMSPNHHGSAFVRPLPDRPYSVAGQYQQGVPTIRMSVGPPPPPDRRSYPTEYTGYLSSPERRLPTGKVVRNVYGITPNHLPPASQPAGPPSGPMSLPYEHELYGYGGSRPSSVAGVIDDVTRVKMENMERQLVNLTGLVAAALQPSTRDGTKEKSRKQQQPLSKPAASTSSSSFSPFSRLSSKESQLSIAMSPELYHQLHSLKSKTKDLKSELFTLRNIARSHSQQTRDMFRETCHKVERALDFLNSNDPIERRLRLDRLRLFRDEELYRNDVRKLDKDLTDLESSVEELRSNVIIRRCKVNMSDVESMAHVLSRASKTVADLKLRYPHLQESLRKVMQAEMEVVVREEKFLKEEPEKLDAALRRCKKLTGTLVTLKRLASVQEQRSSVTSAIGSSLSSTGGGSERKGTWSSVDHRGDQRNDTSSMSSSNSTSTSTGQTTIIVTNHDGHHQPSQQQSHLQQQQQSTSISKHNSHSHHHNDQQRGQHHREHHHFSNHSLTLPTSSNSKETSPSSSTSTGHRDKLEPSNLPNEEVNA